MMAVGLCPETGLAWLPAGDRAAFRHRLADAIECLIALLDALDGDSGIADLDARGDPELCWAAKGLLFDGSGAAAARIALAEASLPNRGVSRERL